MHSRIYLDHSATTPLAPRVLEAMLPHLSGEFGNPSSLHQEGRTAREAVETARAQVASLIGAEPEEIIFTASGTEADNLALVGAVRASGAPGTHRHQFHRARRDSRDMPLPRAHGNENYLSAG